MSRERKKTDPVMINTLTIFENIYYLMVKNNKRTIVHLQLIIFFQLDYSGGSSFKRYDFLSFTYYCNKKECSKQSRGKQTNTWNTHLRNEQVEMMMLSLVSRTIFDKCFSFQNVSRITTL